MSASFRSILSHTAIFLSGIFIALLISTAQLTSHHDYLNVGVNSLQNTLSESIRGAPSSSVKELQSRLIEEQRKMLELQSQISQLRQQNSSSVIDTGSSDSHSQSTPSSTTQYLREQLLQSYNNNIEENQHSMEDNNICSILPKPTPTTLSLWSTHLSSIFNASKHSADSKEYIFHDFSAQLLNIMTPDRLQRSVKTLPLDWTPVERSLDILYKRLMAIQSEVDNYKKEKNLKSNDVVPEEVMKRINTNTKLPRKLNILVMGGSVTMGVVCHINPVTSATGKYSRRNCAWPGRLGYFFSQLFLGYELIDFHTLALGGTNTESGITMWDYSLLPGDVPYPDIVINA